MSTLQENNIKRGEGMTIGEILQINSPGIYKKLIQIGKADKPKKKIELGDSTENLMSANSYKRVRGALRQTRWG